MARSYGKRSRGGRSRIEVDPVTQLHIDAAKLFDLGDGHGADWAAGAEALFQCGFAFLRNVPAGDPRGATIARRVLDLATSLVAGSEDSGAAYTAPGARPVRQAFAMTAPAPERDFSR